MFHINVLKACPIPILQFDSILFFYERNILSGYKYIHLVKKGKSKAKYNTNIAPSMVCAGDMEVL